MSAAMASLLQPKRFAAVIAAYVVALQAILPFLVLPAFAVGTGTIICASAANEPSLPATGHGPTCPSGVFCSMPGCSGAAAPSVGYDIGQPILVAPSAVVAARPVHVVIDITQRKPAPRAPPLA